MEPTVEGLARDIKLVGDLTCGAPLVENKVEDVELELMSEPAAGHGHGRIS